MLKLRRAKVFLGLFLLVPAVAGSACSFGSITAQKPTISETVGTESTPSPTPAYKPLKRVSRDVLDSDKKDKTGRKGEAAKSKNKK